MSSSSKLFMASEPESNTATATKPALVASEPTGAPTLKSTRGRKPGAKGQGGGGAGGGAKKPPQRGLGVAQLERLRLQERWKKMTEMPPPPPHQHQPHQAHVVMPLESVPVQYGAGGYGGAAGRLVLGGQFGSSAVSVVMDHGNNLVDPRSYHGVVVGAPDHQYHHHHDHQNQYQMTRVDHDHHNQHFNQATRELSSTPKNHNTLLGSDDSFDICSFKKKRFNGEIDGNGLNFYSLNYNTENNVINIPNYNKIGDHLTLGFGTPNSKVPRSSSGHNIVHNLDQYSDEGVEVMAVHRKGIGSANVGINDHHDHVVMEYRFFPGQAGGSGKNDIVSSSSGTGFKKIHHEKIWPSEIGSVSAGDQLEASYNNTNNMVSSSTTNTTSYNNIGADNCNLLDLSLKL